MAENSADDTGTPVGVNHVVLNVRDIEESHRFWTEIVGLKQVGALRPAPTWGDAADALLQRRSRRENDSPRRGAGGEPERAAAARGMGTIRRTTGDQPHRDRDAGPRTWQKRLAVLQTRGVKFHLRINHGVTHSVYISDPNGYGVELLYELPRDLWERDIDAGLNYLELLPTEGAEALVDDVEHAPRFGTAAE